MSELPISNALAEAQPDSLQDLFSRDPFSLQTQDFQRVIEEMRALAQRLDAAAQEGRVIRNTRIRQTPSASAKSPLLIDPNEDLGI